MNAVTGARYDDLLDELRAEFPRFRLVYKDRAPSQRLIHGALWLLTLGQMRTYLSGYHTTIGQAVYVTPDWDRKSFATRCQVLRHERVHLRQFRRYSFVGMALLYLLVPLPLGLAYFRMRFEREAYAESVRAAAEIHGVAHVRDPDFRAGIIGQFTSASYGWMWPFPRGLERWYDELVADLC